MGYSPWPDIGVPASHPPGAAARKLEANNTTEAVNSAIASVIWSAPMRTLNSSSVCSYFLPCASGGESELPVTLVPPCQARPDSTEALRFCAGTARKVKRYCREIERPQTQRPDRGSVRGFGHGLTTD